MKIAAMISYISSVLAIVFGMITTPLIVNTLGVSEYGVYVLFGSLIVTLTMFDLGLNNTVIRYISRYRAVGDIDKQQDFLGTVTIIYCLISIVILLLGYIIYNNLVILFPLLTDLELDLAKNIFFVLIMTLSLSIPGGIFNAIATANEKFILIRISNLAKMVIRTLTLLAILDIYGDALSIVIMDSIITLITIVFMAWYSIAKLKVKFKFNNLSFELFKEILSYSVWIFIFAIYMRIQWESGKIILGFKSSIDLVSMLSIGIMLGLYFSSIATTILSMFIPKANRLIAQENGKEHSLNFAKIVSSNIFNLLTPVFIAFAFFGKEFIELWLGKGFETVYFVTLVIMVLYIPVLMQGFMNSILEAIKKVKIKALISLFSGVVGMLISNTLADEYHITGVLVGFSIGWIISLISVNIYYIKLGIPAYNLLLPKAKYVFKVSVFFMFCMMINEIQFTDSLITFVTKITLTMVCLFALYYRIYKSIIMF